MAIQEELFVAPKEKPSPPPCRRPPQLYRSEKERVIAGVAGGLAERFDFEPNIVRLVFILLGLLFGLGIILYLILWILLPTESKLSQSESQNIRENTQNVAAQTQGVIQRLGSALQAEPRVWLAILIIFLGLAVSILTGFGFFNFLGLGPILLLIISLLLIVILINGKQD